MTSHRKLNTLYRRTAAKRGHSGKTLIWLRNRIVEALTNWEQLGCIVSTGDHFFGMGQKKKNIGFHLFIFGTAKDGRAILLYPIRPHNKSGGILPRRIREFMMEYDARGAIVGTCTEIGDAWDVVIDDPEYPRKKRTYTHRKRPLNDDSEE
jgi:hypothetical protein